MYIKFNTNTHRDVCVYAGAAFVVIHTFPARAALDCFRFMSKLDGIKDFVMFG